MCRRVTPWTFACLVQALAAVAQPVAQPPSDPGVAEAEATRPRPRLALALSGGGARGIAHIGVLRALEEAGLPVDAIAANSMGAVVGGIYASGRTAAQLEAIVRSMGWASLFNGRPDRRALPLARRLDRYGSTAGVNFDWKTIRLQAGLLDDHRINRFLIAQLAPAGYAASGDFDSLPIPFRAVAADLSNGEQVVLAHGDLALAVRASMAIPLVLDPITWEGRPLVDGLIVNNLPIDVARSFGAAVVLAIDVGNPSYDPSVYRSSVGAAAQVLDLLSRRRYRDFDADADVLVRPDLGEHSVADYSGFGDLIRAGYEAMRASLPALRARLEAAGISDLSPRRRLAAGPVLEGTRIASVRLEGNRRVSEALARRVFDIPVGPGYLMARGLNAFDKIDASGLFDWTWQAFEPTQDGVGIVLQVRESAPNRAEIGVAYSEWERARGSIRLRNQNTLGFGEELELLLASSDAESLVKASLSGSRLFVVGLGYRLSGYAGRDKPRFFDDQGEEINRARFDRQGLDVALRTSFERWGLLEAGVRIGRMQTRSRTGIDLPESDDQVGALFGSLEIDTLDDLTWPDRGRRLVLRGERSLAALGGDLSCWRLEAAARTARRVRRLAVQLDGRVALSGGDLPVSDWHRLGGTILPGYRQEELKGAQLLAGALSLRYRVAGQLRVLVRGGTGAVAKRRRNLTLDGLRWGAGLGLYHPSPIGPVSLELGVRDGGARLATLTVGWD